MPLNYQGTCSSCGQSVMLGTPVSGAIFVDAPIAEEVRKAGDLVVARRRASEQVAEGVNLIELAHPCESSIMESHGFTDQQLQREGRYVRITRHICRRCGNVFNRYELRAMSTIGCGSILLISAACALIAGVAVGLVSSRAAEGLPAAMAVFAITAVILESVGKQLGKRYLQSHFAERAKLIARNPACPNCGVDDSVIIDKASASVCAGCKNRSLRIKPVGRS